MRELFISYVTLLSPSFDTPYHTGAYGNGNN